MNKYDNTLNKEVRRCDFIKRVSEFHSNKYDYGLVEYINNITKVVIVCPLHGKFEQTPKVHKLRGCVKCSGRYRLTTEEFIKECNIIHNNRYDYTLVEYDKGKNRVKIICRIHGMFNQITSEHRRGQNCPKCSIITGSRKRTLTTSDFIKRSKRIHNNRYDYTLVNYTKTTDEVDILCPTHGLFSQIAMNHLSGYGCLGCYNDRRNYKRSEVGFNDFMGTEEFIKKSIEIHNNKYDYSKSIYRGSKDKLIIICNKHGEYEMRPNSHLNGQGCGVCGNISKRLTNDEFLDKAWDIHRDTYTYKSKYIKSDIGIDIKCKEHGVFSQTPHAHLKGQGCPVCNSSKGEQEIERILQLSGVTYETQKTFEGCMYKQHLKFDFYIPSNNMCIEYDGEQHYRPIEFFGGIERFKKQQKYDSIKESFCEENNIKLIRIPYTEFSNIEKIITSLYV